MNDAIIKCYKVDSEPYALIFPEACVAGIVEAPEIIVDPSHKAAWMAGYIVWNSQEIPLLCFENLVNAQFERPTVGARVTVLNPIPKAARKTYGALLSFGAVQEVQIASDVSDTNTPTQIDRRYVEGALTVHGDICIIPRLAALGVAFSYF